MLGAVGVADEMAEFLLSGNGGGGGGNFCGWHCPFPIPFLAIGGRESGRNRIEVN